jgi:hypothetical protein
MTVQEVRDALAAFPPDANVYVPDIRDGTVQIVQEVGTLVHLNGIEGVNIPDDVYLIPWGNS